MWFAAPRRSPVWTDKQFGVLCLVKDFTKKSHFIRLVDIIGVCMIIFIAILLCWGICVAYSISSVPEARDKALSFFLGKRIL